MTEQVKTPEATLTFAQLLKDHVLTTIDPYKSTLEEKTEEDEKLGKPARNRLEQHLGELEILRGLLKRLTSGEEFRAVVSLRKRLPDALGDLSSETYTFRLAPKQERLLPGTSQNQLGLHLNVDAKSDKALDTMHSIALSKLSAYEVLQGYFRESLGQRITINTVDVFRNEIGGFSISPQAGISFQWIRGQETAKVGGVTWVGYRPYFLALPERSMALDPFMQIQRTIINLTEKKTGK